MYAFVHLGLLEEVSEGVILRTVMSVLCDSVRGMKGFGDVKCELTVMEDVFHVILRLGYVR